MSDQFLFSLTIAGIYLLAGSVKGVFGIGLPTTSITLMTMFIAPLEAIAINLLPMFVTNGYQFYKAEPSTTFGLLLAICLSFVIFSSYFFTRFPEGK